MPNGKSDIDADILIETLVREYPKSVGFLAERNIKCIACGEPVWGTLREAAEEKGFSDEEIESIVRDLSAYLAGKSKGNSSGQEEGPLDLRL